MNELVTTVQVEITPKLYNGIPVVTFSDIDNAHKKAKGQAKVSFSRNKKHFIEGMDYFLLKPTNTQKYQNDTLNLKNIPPRGITVLTESGYLMVAKSFNDDLSWEVQRQLVNGYFKARATTEKQIDATLPPAIPNASNYSLPPARPNWFGKINNRMVSVINKYGCTRAELYHRILVECGNRYDLKVARKKYRKAMGFAPQYPFDLVTFFPQLQEVAEKYIDYLLSENVR